jgi:quercetin dioxygenase-like cupin family protein
MTGLTARVWLGDEEFLVQSPAAVFVPRNVEHTLQLVAGSGKFINIVPNPDYNESLR